MIKKILIRKKCTLQKKKNDSNTIYTSLVEFFVEVVGVTALLCESNRLRHNQKSTIGAPKEIYYSGLQQVNIGGIILIVTVLTCVVIFPIHGFVYGKGPKTEKNQDCNKDMCLQIAFFMSSSTTRQI